MLSDAVLKRWFPLVVVALLAGAARLQASGFASLVSAALLIDQVAVRPAPSQRPPPPEEPDEHATSAAPILARNPFDAITGALDTPAVQIAAMQPSDALPDTDPYDDPACDTGQVVLIVESDDPSWSFAAIAAPGARAQLRRRGDEVGGRTLSAIARDRVWLGAVGARCQLRLGIRPPKPSPPPRGPAGKPSSSGLPPDIAARIQKISETELNIDRSAVDAILEKQAELMRGARVIPVKEGNKVAGFRLLRIAGGSLLGALGLKNGDQIRTINGVELGDPQKALEGYTRLRSADHLALALVRGGKQLTINLHIR